MHIQAHKLIKAQIDIFREYIRHDTFYSKFKYKKIPNCSREKHHITLKESPIRLSDISSEILSARRYSPSLKGINCHPSICYPEKLSLINEVKDCPTQATIKRIFYTQATLQMILKDAFQTGTENVD